MKKRILILTLSLLLALSASACGSQPSSENSSEDRKNPSQNMPDSPGGGDNVSPGQPDSPGGTNIPSQNIPGSAGGSIDFPGGTGSTYTTLTDWYNSPDRPWLEDILNALIDEFDIMSFFITIEEPDVLIYNYQYTHPLDFSVFSREATAAEIAANMEELDAASVNIDNIREFRSTYGLPLRILRVTYLDADGSPVYSRDFTEDMDVSGIPDGSGAAAGVYADLQDWLDHSEDATLTVESTNQMLASTGITFDIAVDGNVLIYKYSMPDGSWASGLSEEELTAAFDPMVESMSGTIDTIFTVFADQYGMTVDAVRIVYCSSKGAELYSRDFLP